MFLFSSKKIVVHCRGCIISKSSRGSFSSCLCRLFMCFYTSSACICGGKGQGKEEVVAQVAELVQLERQRADAAETIAAAQGLAQANAEALLHRIVAHFQHLFAVEQLEGVLPAMNQACTSLAVCFTGQSV